MVADRYFHDGRSFNDISYQREFLRTVTCSLCTCRGVPNLGVIVALHAGHADPTRHVCPIHDAHVSLRSTNF